MTDREAAWWALHDALPDGWRLGELTFDPAIGQYELAAMSPRPHGRGKPLERTVVGRGVDELAAVCALTAALADGGTGRRNSQLGAAWDHSPAFFSELNTAA